MGEHPVDAVHNTMNANALKFIEANEDNNKGIRRTNETEWKIAILGKNWLLFDEDDVGGELFECVCVFLGEKKRLVEIQAAFRVAYFVRAKRITHSRLAPSHPPIAAQPREKTDKKLGKNGNFKHDYQFGKISIDFPFGENPEFRQGFSIRTNQKGWENGCLEYFQELTAHQWIVMHRQTK